MSSLQALQQEAQEKFNDFNNLLKETELKLERIRQETIRKEKELDKIGDFVSKNSKIDKSKFMAFMKKPFKMIRVSSSKYHVLVPKWVPNFQIGWMIDEGIDDEFFTYEVNRFSSMLGDIPQELADKLDLQPKINGIVKDNKVIFDKKEIAEKLFKGHILRWGVDEAEIKGGHEFDVILSIIEAGGIPFEKIPLQDEDLRSTSFTFGLYDYQNEAVKLFKKTGAVGVYYPTGAGKSFIAMAAMDMITGKKILVTKKTLIDQWKAYFENNCPRLLEETTLVTYEYLRNHPELLKQEWAMVVFDECHKLPATSFAKLALIKCKYRLGLSATPHREDGNEKMIFALTGYPIGLNWKVYMETVKRKYHAIHIHLVNSTQQKLSKITKLLDRSKKTLIFSDSIELGASIARKFEIPHVHGGTEQRTQTMTSNQVCVVSRVADEGVSIDTLQRIIEVDFLYGSRAQSTQRTGRLMHSQKAERHDIIMTVKEFESYGKRIWVLQEKGFHVKIIE